jgi:hypothetical protein
VASVTERKLVVMAFDLFISLVAMGVRFTLVLGVMLFIVSLGRDDWDAFSRDE